VGDLAYLRRTSEAATISLSLSKNAPKLTPESPRVQHAHARDAVELVSMCIVLQADLYCPQGQPPSPVQSEGGTGSETMSSRPLHTQPSQWSLRYHSGHGNDRAVSGRYLNVDDHIADPRVAYQQRPARLGRLARKAAALFGHKHVARRRGARPEAEVIAEGLGDGGSEPAAKDLDVFRVMVKQAGIKNPRPQLLGFVAIRTVGRSQRADRADL
jgi:hypothetical protein